MSQASGSAGYGELVQDPGGVLDLPAGFQYRVISEQGTTLSNGAPVPGDFDGMAAFPGPSSNTTVLVRNHELSPSDRTPPGRWPVYDPVLAATPTIRTPPAGTTGVVVNLEDRTEIEDFVTSSGTLEQLRGRGDAVGHLADLRGGPHHGPRLRLRGGPERPRERTFAHPDPGHGLLLARGGRHRPGHRHRLPDRGRLQGRHRGREDGGRRRPLRPDEGGTGTRVSFLYRYIPRDRSQRPGALQKGGRLQVLTLEKRPNYNVDLAFPGDRFQVVWKDVKPEEPHESAEDLGRRAIQSPGGRLLRGRGFLVRRHHRRREAARPDLPLPAGEQYPGTLLRRYRDGERWRARTTSS